MGYRFLLVLFAIFTIGGCAAFDSDNTPYTGFDPDIIPVLPGGQVGIHNGFYTGTLTLDTNECASLVDAAGTVSNFAVDVLHVDKILNLTFEDGSVAAGELVGDGAIFMVKDGSTENVYYLTFSDEDETVNGSLEVIEPSEAGQYGDACAIYTVSMEEGEKPENFGTGAVADDASGGSDDENAGEAEEGAEGEEAQAPWEMPGA